MEEKLEQKRHTLAHLMAAAVLKEYPHAKPTIGPAIDNGFYYDFDFSDGEVPGDNDLKNIQKNNNGNAGTIELRNYFVSGNSLISPCVVSNQIYSGADGQNFTLNFNYTKCCE